MTWTADERALLRKLHTCLGELLASPDSALWRYRQAEHSGGGHGFGYEFGKTAVSGTWHEFLVADTFPDGEPRMWRRGALLRSARITYARLRAWRDSLPPEVLADAVTWWRTYPECTRDLGKLSALVLEQLAEPEPETLLDLLETP